MVLFFVFVFVFFCFFFWFVWVWGPHLRHMEVPQARDPIQAAGVTYQLVFNSSTQEL